MPLRGNRKRQYQRDYRPRKKLRRAGLVEQQSERKVLFPVRIPEGVLGRIMRLTHEGIAKGTHPWKTPADTFRALLIKGLESMKGEDPTIDEMLPYLNLTRQFEGISSNRREAQAAMHRATTEIGELIGIGAKHEALQYYHVTLAATVEMPPTVWRDWLIAELKHAFPQLDKQAAPGIDLKQNPHPEQERRKKMKS